MYCKCQANRHSSFIPPSRYGLLDRLYSSETDGELFGRNIMLIRHLYVINPRLSCYVDIYSTFKSRCTTVTTGTRHLIDI